nr:DUF3265 domain-containing protein [Vibrio anguillarum]
MGSFKKVSNKTPNKRFKRDSQRAAFLSCVGFCDSSVMRKLGSSEVRHALAIPLEPFVIP